MALVQKGRKSRYPHTHDVLRGAKIPFVSWNVDATGDQHLVMRPPFTEALLKHFLSYGLHNNKLSMGHRMVLDGQECVLFTPLGFTPPDHATAAETQTRFGVWAGIEPNQKWWPGSSAEIGLFGHVTSVGNGLAIAHDMGQMKTSTGKCGLGSYFFTSDRELSLDDAIAQLWGKKRSYNRGCLVVARMHGQCVSMNSSWSRETEVPAGTFAKKKGCGEFSAHPKYVEIVNIIQKKNMQKMASTPP